MKSRIPEPVSLNASVRLMTQKSEKLALRYTVNANLIFKWLRDPKYRPAPGTGSEEAGLCFLPVEIIKEAPVTRSIPAAENHIEIDLAGGHRMRISGSYDPEALSRLIRGLSA